MTTISLVTATFSIQIYFLLRDNLLRHDYLLQCDCLLTLNRASPDHPSYGGNNLNQYPTSTTCIPSTSRLPPTTRTSLFSQSSNRLLIVTTIPLMAFHDVNTFHVTTISYATIFNVASINFLLVGIISSVKTTIFSVKIHLPHDDLKWRKPKPHSYTSDILQHTKV